MAVPVPQMAPAPNATPPTPGKVDSTKLRALPANTARIVVDLPADAKLFVDDQPTQSATSQRVFRTPTLEPQGNYYYDLRAEIVRDGKMHAQTKRVVIRAGEEMRVVMEDPPAAMAQVEQRQR
jgi:uncharacterized protein (TIGR03000 family)